MKLLLQMMMMTSQFKLHIILVDQKDLKIIKIRSKFDNPIRYPKSYFEAIDSEESDKWKAAMNYEYNSLMKHNTWTLVEHKNADKVIDVKWIYRIKPDGRYKARLVAFGYTQERGVDYDQIYSPIIFDN